MSRLVYLTSSLLLIVGVVAALVRAQETGGPQPTDRWSRPAAPAAGAPPQARLAQHLQNVGQAVSAEYQGGTASLGQPSLTPPRNQPAQDPRLRLTAHQEPASELRSVLTRRSTISDRGAAPDAAPPEPAGPEARTAAASAPLTEPPLPREPGLLQTDSAPLSGAAQAPLSGVPQAPPSGATQAPATSSPPSAAPPAEGTRISSRRTFQSPETTSAVPLVASQPMSPAVVAPSQEAAVVAGSDTLSSTTGALLRVVTVGPSALTIGATGQIAVRLSNLGSSSAEGAEVRVTIPQNLEVVAAEVDDGSTRMQRDGTASSLIWNLDQVPPRAERVLTIKAIPRSTEPLALAVQWSVAPLQSLAQIQVQEPRLELTLRGPAEIAYGETKVFTVVVANPGTGEARDVSLQMSLGEQSADTLQVGTIPAGAQREFDVEVTAREAGSMQILAAAVGAAGLKAEAQEQVRVRRADLKLEAVGSATKYAGSVGTYQLRVFNAGDAAAGDVLATVRLPMGAKYVQGLENAVQEGADLKWTVGPLGGGEERVYRFFCQLSEEGDAPFEFLVRGNNGLEASGLVRTQVQALADLKMTVNDPKGPVAVGQEVVWEIQVTNRGTKAATQVQVLAQFSEGIEPAAAEGARAELVPGQVVFQPIARVNAGETVKLTVRAKAERDGNHLFRAELRCTDPEFRLVAEDTTTFYGDDLLGSPAKPVTSETSQTTPASPATPPVARQPGAWTAK